MQFLMLRIVWYIHKIRNAEGKLSALSREDIPNVLRQNGLVFGVKGISIGVYGFVVSNA